MHKKNDTLVAMARPRLTIELYQNELNHMLRLIAAKERSTVRKVVLTALAAQYPELDDMIAIELKD